MFQFHGNRSKILFLACIWSLLPSGPFIKAILPIFQYQCCVALNAFLSDRSSAVVHLRSVSRMRHGQLHTWHILLHYPHGANAGCDLAGAAPVIQTGTPGFLARQDSAEWALVGHWAGRTLHWARPQPTEPHVVRHAYNPRRHETVHPILNSCYFIPGSRFGFCVVSKRIQASRCVADRPLAVLTVLAEPDPVTRLGKNKHGGRYLSHTHYKLLNSSALEVSLVNKMFHL